MWLKLVFFLKWNKLLGKCLGLINCLFCLIIRLFLFKFFVFVMGVVCKNVLYCVVRLFLEVDIGIFCVRLVLSEFVFVIMILLFIFNFKKV